MNNKQEMWGFDGPLLNPGTDLKKLQKYEQVTKTATVLTLQTAAEFREIKQEPPQED